MAAPVEKATQHLGETKGARNHDHDLVHELSKRLDALWRYDQYIANAEGEAAVQQLWQDFKVQEQENVDRLKKLIGDHAKKGCF